jgi:hypothetical protein
MRNNIHQKPARSETGHLEGIIPQEGNVLHIGEHMVEPVGEILEPHLGRIGKFANLAALLREVETKYEAAEDLHDLRSRLVVAAKKYGIKRYRLGEALHNYRAAIHHGAWLPIVRAVALESDLSERNVREIAADYLRVEGLPEPLVVELERAQIDPSAKSKSKLLKIAVLGYIAGQTPEQAVQAALVAVRSTAPAAKSRSSSSQPTTEAMQIHPNSATCPKCGEVFVYRSCGSASAKSDARGAEPETRISA